ncbi:SEC-C metal-binding domain-containing protein [Sutcliffiella horikoshii]|uniref:SEC-C metal-binding domain-containing protein n=1 Tax=Sutcliffiella horikoshii TaxID=79883 RepID=UPI003CF84B37
MPYIPAVCDFCGTMFASGIYVENSQVSFSGNKAGPCPNCGKSGHIPDGVFNFIGNAIQILNAPDRTIFELERFSDILGGVIEERTTPEQFEEKVKKEAPALSPILSLLPKTREEKREDFKFTLAILIQVIIAIITLSSQAADSNSDEEKTNPVIQEIEVNQVINQVYVNNNNTNIHVNQPQQDIPNSVINSIKTEKIGRNEPCPCESGLKYKRCHGR